MTETRAIRLKRLAMRSQRRGTREMDLVLGGFAEARLEGFDEAGLDAWEALLAENDQDINAWITGLAEPPTAHAPLIAALRRFLGLSANF